MYEQFYHLSEDPFRLTPDPRYAFAHPSYAKARAYLEYGIQRGEGFVAVTGPPGSGKTTLVEELLTRVPPGVRVSHLVSSQLEAEDLLRMVAHALGLAGAQAGKADTLNSIRECLQEDRLNGRRTVLIVDEAQGLDSPALEELRLLTNLCDPRGPLLQIILLGQAQLREVLKRPELEQLRQRMIAAYHLKPMAEQDTRDYVAHRLRCADWAGDPVISDMAVRVIHHAGGGNPRRINLLCSRLMLHGYVGSKHYLTVADVRVVLEEMEEEELASWDDSLEDLLQEEEQREQAEESRLANARPVPAMGRAEAKGGGRGRVPDPLTTVSPSAERCEPVSEPFHVAVGEPPAADPASTGGAPGSAEEPPVADLPRMAAGERLAEPPPAPRRTVQGGSLGRGNGWVWLVGGVLVFLLAALVAVIHEPSRTRVSQWLESAQASIQSRVGVEQAAPAEDSAGADDGGNPTPPQ